MGSVRKVKSARERGEEFRKDVIAQGTASKKVVLHGYVLDPWDILPVVNFYQGLLEEQESKK